MNIAASAMVVFLVNNCQKKAKAKVVRIYIYICNIIYIYDYDGFSKVLFTVLFINRNSMRGVLCFTCQKVDLHHNREFKKSTNQKSCSISANLFVMGSHVQRCC